MLPQNMRFHKIKSANGVQEDWHWLFHPNLKLKRRFDANTGTKLDFTIPHLKLFYQNTFKKVFGFHAGGVFITSISVTSHGD